MKYVKQKTTPQHDMSRKVGRGAFRSCWHCGLIALSNEATRQAIARGCVQDQEKVEKNV